MAKPKPSPNSSEDFPWDILPDNTKLSDTQTIMFAKMFLTEVLNTYDPMYVRDILYYVKLNQGTVGALKEVFNDVTDYVYDKAESDSKQAEADKARQEAESLKSDPEHVVLNLFDGKEYTDKAVKGTDILDEATVTDLFARQMFNNDINAAKDFYKREFIDKNEPSNAYNVSQLLQNDQIRKDMRRDTELYSLTDEEYDKYLTKPLRASNVQESIGSGLQSYASLLGQAMELMGRSGPDNFREQAITRAQGYAPTMAAMGALGSVAKGFANTNRQLATSKYGDIAKTLDLNRAKNIKVPYGSSIVSRAAQTASDRMARDQLVNINVPSNTSDVRVKTCTLSDERLKHFSGKCKCGSIDNNDVDELLEGFGFPKEMSEDKVDDYAKYIRNFLYNYKEEATAIDPSINPNEEHCGPMAQAIEKVNPACIKETEDGTKTVDTGRLALMNAGVIGDLARRLEAIEEKVL